MRNRPSMSIGESIRRLRLAAKLTQRELSRILNYRLTDISDYERGLKLPEREFLVALIRSQDKGKSQDPAFQAILAEIELQDSPASTISAHAWHPKDAVCPYRGLFAFREEDSERFFGRNDFVDVLIKRLEISSLVGVVGPSGCGKSSVVYAGLFPAYRKQSGFRGISFRPGARPFDTLAVALAPLLYRDIKEPSWSGAREVADAIRNGNLFIIIEDILKHGNTDSPFLIFIDQFEEFFTQCQNEETRSAFVDALVELAISHSGNQQRGLRIVFTLRSDFIGHVMQHRPFADQMQDNILYLPPLNLAELRDAVVEPAVVAGVQFEKGLVEKIVNSAGNSLGSLPLVEFSLTLMWDRMLAGGNYEMMHSCYNEIGQLSGAVAKHAEDLFSALNGEQKLTARHIFTRLVHLGRSNENIADARKRVNLDEFKQLPDAGAVIDAAVNSRLVVIDFDSSDSKQTIEVSHEAVIRNWRRLTSWLEEDRAMLVWAERVNFLTQEWIESDYDDSFLLRGSRLGESRNFLEGEMKFHLSDNVLKFLDASRENFEREEKVRVMTQVDFLIKAKHEEVPDLIKGLRKHALLVLPRLNELNEEIGVSERWRVQLALAFCEKGHEESLIQSVFDAPPAGVQIVCRAAKKYFSKSSDFLWAVAEDSQSLPHVKLRALAMLSQVESVNSRLGLQSHFIAHELSRNNPLELRDWIDVFRPAKNFLVSGFRDILTSSNVLETQREASAAILVDLVADQPDILAELASESSEHSYQRFMTALESNEQSIDVSKRAFRKVVATTTEHTSSEPQRIIVGKKRAVAAISLLHLNENISLFDCLSSQNDFEAIHQFVHQCYSRQLSLTRLTNLLTNADYGIETYAVLLAIGSYPKDKLLKDQTLKQTCLNLFSNHPNSGVHGASKWLLGHLGMWDQISELERSPVKPDLTGRRDWFRMVIGSSSYTFTLLAPSTFMMGSPGDEIERSEYEGPQHSVSLTRPFAMCTREVTRGEFEEYLKTQEDSSFPNIDEWSPDKNSPVVAANWFESVGFCNWLSTRAGFDDAEHPCQPVGKDMNVMRLNMDRLGFRLPLESEWEFAARCGSITPYSFGSDRELLKYYAWTQDNSNYYTHSEGILRPNRSGIFSMHGNCWEWCHDWFGPYGQEHVTDPHGRETGDRRVMRGGCWNLNSRYARCATRNAHVPTNRNYYMGIRIVCTMAKGEA